MRGFENWSQTLHSQQRLRPPQKELEIGRFSEISGVTLSTDLRWNRHIDNITHKANQTLGFLRRNLKIKSIALKTKAYRTLVRPTLEYAAQSGTRTVKPISTNSKWYNDERLDTRTRNRYHNISSVGEMLDQLGWESLQNRRQMLRLSMMYKIHNGLVAMDPQGHMTPIRRKSRFVHTLGYEVPRSQSTNYHHYSFFPRTIRDWNRLPETTVQAPNLRTLSRDGYRTQMNVNILKTM